MKYQKSAGVSGTWVDKAKLIADNISKGKIVSETMPIPSSFKDSKGNPQTQDVAKVQFEGWPEPVNVSINKPTLNALIDAFGDDSVSWQGHTLRVETEKVKVSGKTSIALYLIPDGYKKMDDAQGYTVIVSDATEFPDIQVGEDGDPGPEVPF